MKIVDANVLLYAINEDASVHQTAYRWLTTALEGSERVGLPWLSLVAFIRIAAHSRLFDAPWSVAQAFAQVDEWLTAPAVVDCAPGRKHLRVWRGLQEQVGAGGNLVNDAYLAALAIESQATVVTYDTDFARFDGVAWATPERLLSASR